MDAITKERVRVAMAKVVIALGYDVQAGRYRHHPNVRMAIRALEALEESLQVAGESPIESLPLDSSTVQFLYQSGIRTINQLAAMSDLDLIQLEKIGRKRLLEIATVLEEAGFTRGK